MDRERILSPLRMIGEGEGGGCVKAEKSLAGRTNSWPLWRMGTRWRDWGGSQAWRYIFSWTSIWPAEILLGIFPIRIRHWWVYVPSGHKRNCKLWGELNDEGGLDQLNHERRLDKLDDEGGDDQRGVDQAKLDALLLGRRAQASLYSINNVLICPILPRSPNTGGHHRLPPYHPPPPPHRKTNGGAGLVFEVDPNHILLCTAVISLGFEQTFALNNSQYDSIAEPSGRPSYLQPREQLSQVSPLQNNWGHCFSFIQLSVLLHIPFSSPFPSLYSSF